MIRLKSASGSVAFLSILLFLSPAFSETIELVTYYPASSSGGDLHARSLTVGTAYQNEAPGDGTALISDRLGIGTVDPPSLLGLGVNTGAAGTRQAITIGSAGRAAPTAEGTQSAGDKLVLWNDAAAPVGPYKAGIGLNANNELWLQSSGNNATNKIAFYTSNNSTTPSQRMVIDSQGRVGIGAAAPAASAALEVNSVNGGFLPPRMTTAQRNAIPAPATGLIIYNLTTNQPNFFNGTAWVPIGPTITLWTAASSALNGPYSSGSFVQVTGMSVANVDLIAGDILQVTLTGDFRVGSANVNGYSRLRFTFNNAQFGPFIDVGAVASATNQYGYPLIVFLAAGAGAGQIPPGTYTIRLEAMGNAAGSTANILFNPNGGGCALYVQRTRSS